MFILLKVTEKMEKLNLEFKKNMDIQMNQKHNNLETGEILPYSPIISIDQEQVDFDAQFDGINVLVTSEIDMSDERIE